MVEMKMRTGINHIDKFDFLEVYLSARTEAFRSDTIKNSFGAAGLVPFSPDRVISQLDIQLRTPDPPLKPGKRLVAEIALELNSITKKSFVN